MFIWEKTVQGHHSANIWPYASDVVMSICIYLCVCTCMQAYVWLRMCMCVHVCVCVSMDKCVYVCVPWMYLVNLGKMANQQEDYNGNPYNYNLGSILGMLYNVGVWWKTLSTIYWYICMHVYMDVCLFLDCVNVLPTWDMMLIDTMLPTQYKKHNFQMLF